MNIASLNVVTIIFTLVAGDNKSNLSYISCPFDHRCICSTSPILDIDCNNTQITRNDIPYFPRNVNQLNLGFNFLVQIRNNTFHLMHELSKLDLSWNEITVIEEGTFDDLHNLQELHFEGNLINCSQGALPMSVFKSLTSLKFLNVAKMQNCKRFPDFIISGLTRLESIVIDIRPIVAVPEFGVGYLSLKHFKRLKAGFCILLGVDKDTFVNLPYVEYLDLQNCLLMQIESKTFTANTNLTYLDISNNNLLIDVFPILSQALPNSLKILKMSNSMRDLYSFNPNLIFKSDETSLEEFYINGNKFVYALGDEDHKLPSTLRIADFSNNILMKFCFDMPNLLALDLRNNSLGVYLASNRYTYSNETTLKQVDLSLNEIHDLTFPIFHGHAYTTKINLSYNKLTDISFDLSHLVRLEILDLSHNNIWSVSKLSSLDILHTLSTSAKLNLSYNRLKCSCKNLPFIQWLLENRNMMVQSKGYNCRYENGQIADMRDASLIDILLKKDCRSYTILIVGVTVALLIVLILLFAGLIFRYRWKLRYLLYMTRHKYKLYKSIQSSKHYKYDAFISYANAETGFISNELIPNLERNHNLKLCIHQRDFIPGEEITQNITNGIHQSKMTVCILSQSFLDSYYCMFEFNMARMESIYAREGKNVLFLILYEHIRLKDMPLVMLEFVEQQSYIEYPRDEQGNIVFWEKLKDALL
ncbi:toll-like receptor 4 [Mytilus californianus]|uniref:toll-like receptor 4 n=1 Tax=Mytilus californianus TaxID=6549 RepID=UPI0022481932|nr:toll-like receptor 4 [Mytilus californianus]